LGNKILDLLFYIDENAEKSDYYFNDIFIPDRIVSELSDNFKSSKKYLSVHRNDSDKFSEHDNVLIRDGIDDIAFWKNIFRETSSDYIAFIHGDSPFFDTTVISEIFELHNEFLSEFTFSENLPEGFACEVISAKLIEQLPDFEEETLSLSQVIKKNINQFDVELYYKSPDIRDKRLTFRSSSARERKIMQNIFSINSSTPNYTDIEKIINDNPDSLFLGPTYVEVELNGKCDLDCIFCYKNELKQAHEEMSPEIFKTILQKLQEPGNKYTLSLSGSGDPLDHPNFYEIAELALAENLIEKVIVETNGIKADQNFRNFFLKHRDKLILIFNINGFDQKTYSAIHGKDYFEKVYGNIKALSEDGKKGIYVQVMKINETDSFENQGDEKSFLDKYYDFWEQSEIPIILQKQNTYLGRIEDRTYSDLSPVKRTPCWHLQRDFYILSDGTVAFCKQDIDGENSHGNILTDSLDTILDTQKKYFIEDYRGKLCKSPDCSKCDEWYTFNF